MKFDVIGRIQNMRLPDGKTAILYSVYEAVSNSIHAINDRFGEAQAAKSGRVEVEISTDDEGGVESISVTDNGVGFTPENLLSFETSDSRLKYARGGKGVGRFIWIKLFGDIRVDSVAKVSGKKQRIKFRFMPEKPNSIAYKRVSPARGEETGTTITLSEPRRQQQSRIQAASFLKELALHFFPQFISGTLPDITISYRDTDYDLKEFIGEQVEPPHDEVINVTFDEGEEEIHISHLYVDASLSTGLRNSYLLTAHGRLVGDPVSLTRKYALGDLPTGKAYVAVVRSRFLDDRVDQERLGFQLTGGQRELLESAILQAAERFLSEHIKKVRARQKTTVTGIIREHPQLATQIANIDEYVSTLSPGMDDEQIGQHLFVLLYRDEKDLREKIQQLDQLESLEPESRAQAEEILEELSNQEKHRLAELVVKRHQVLTMANLLLKYDDAVGKTYHYEKVLHELVCPMGEMYKSGEYARHNLWVVDDALAGYEFFASDKSLRSLSDSTSGKEPDLIFFNPLGFRREGTDEPVVIVEFKRPGDEKPSQHPVAQVLGYINELRGHQVRSIDGDVVSDITRETPFECYIVCELTEKTRTLFEESIAQNPTPDGEGYYGWSSRHNALIRVISFKKMLRDAERRNQALFDQLGLGSPSLAAKKRSARARERKAEESVRIRPAPAGA